jgi:hypothetical protein
MFTEAPRMESAPTLVPAPAIVEERRGKPVVIRPPEVSSAHDFAIIGYILTALSMVPAVIIALIVGAYGLLVYLGYGAPLCQCLTDFPPTLTSIPFIGAWLIYLGLALTPSPPIYIIVGGGVFLILLIFLSMIYFGMPRSIMKGRYEKARGSALFFGVLFMLVAFGALGASMFSGAQLAVFAVIPAFFFMLTYGRLGEVIAKYGPVAVMGEAVPGMPIVAPPIPGPLGAIPMGGPIHTGPMAPPMTSAPPRNPQCPTCGKELYYSVNHRRWYCMTCDNPSGVR